MPASLGQEGALGGDHGDPPVDAAGAAPAAEIQGCGLAEPGNGLPHGAGGGRVRGRRLKAGGLAERAGGSPEEGGQCRIREFCEGHKGRRGFLGRLRDHGQGRVAQGDRFRVFGDGRVEHHAPPGRGDAGEPFGEVREREVDGEHAAEASVRLVDRGGAGDPGGDGVKKHVGLRPGPATGGERRFEEGAVPGVVGRDRLVPVELPAAVFVAQEVARAAGRAAEVVQVAAVRGWGERIGFPGLRGPPRHPQPRLRFVPIDADEVSAGVAPADPSEAGVRVQEGQQAVDEHRRVGGVDDTGRHLRGKDFAGGARVGEAVQDAGLSAVGDRIKDPRGEAVGAGPDGLGPLQGQQPPVRKTSAGMRTMRLIRKVSRRSSRALAGGRMRGVGAGGVHARG